MTKIKILFLSFLISITLLGCSSVKQAFDSERKNSSDEFLVEKKKSLSFPPNYNDLPKPKIKNISEHFLTNLHFPSLTKYGSRGITPALSRGVKPLA